MARPASVTVTLFQPEINKVLRSPAGPVSRHLLIRGERIKQAAIRLAPKVTGNLAAHIVKRMTRKGAEPQVLVGVENVPYAIFVHEGTQPHEIVARNASVLSFYWPKVGAMVAFPRVMHPGNAPNRFLLRAAQREGQLSGGQITEGEFTQLTGGT